LDPSFGDFEKSFLRFLGCGMDSSMGVVYSMLKKDRVHASMPVELGRNTQPVGHLHGGASCALGESIASIGTCLNIDPRQYFVAGVDINATHVSYISSGQMAVGEGLRIHGGKRFCVWEVKIYEESTRRLASTIRCTVAILPYAGSHRKSPSTPHDHWANCRCRSIPEKRLWKVSTALRCAERITFTASSAILCIFFLCVKLLPPFCSKIDFDDGCF
jgi:1,4-dihydroxy-2-naphthoyl-CoA hydrolase